MKRPHLLVYGSLAHDRILNFPGRFADHIIAGKTHVLSVSFTVNQFADNFGGTGGNIAYNARLLGLSATLIASLGSGDAAYQRWLKQHRLFGRGVRLVKGEPTAFAYITTDQDDNQIAGFYPGAMRQGIHASLRSLVRRGYHNYLVLAPGNKRDILRLARQARPLGLPYLFDPGQGLPTFGKNPLRRLISHADVLISNDYELSMISRTTGWKVNELAQRVHILITTFGPKGSIIRHGSKSYRIPAARAKNESDPTGAGDAYRAGFLAGYLRGLPLPLAGRLASLTSVYTVERYGTQTHRFTLAGLKKRFYANFHAPLPL